MRRMDVYRTFSALGRRTNDLRSGGPPRYVGAERRSGLARRSGMRARALLTGKLVVGDGEMSLDCVIRNLSSRGARIVLSRAVDLPNRVSLIILREALLCDARVSWRSGDLTGLTFTARHDLQTDTDPHRRGIRALWQALAP
ncbi:MAG TPA: PilZ domain-containing protein [Caulobacteraceae bacterium]|nr:PilZ domain-containing protein [Caulobacteraceae bacterium]